MEPDDNSALVHAFDRWADARRAVKEADAAAHVAVTRAKQAAAKLRESVMNIGKITGVFMGGRKETLVQVGPTVYRVTRGKSWEPVIEPVDLQVLA